MNQRYSCRSGHNWTVDLAAGGDANLDVISCPTCGNPAETVAPLDAAVETITFQQAPPSDSSTSSQHVEASASPGLPEGLRQHPRYRVLRRLGAGGMGDVFLAEHLLMGRLVALKVVRPELLRRPNAAARFHREVRAAARLAHPNIVQAFDAETVGDSHFLVMEYVEGTTLAEVVARDGPFPVDAASDAITQALRGLQHAHECGLVHRDLKPHNLMRTSAGQVKLLDLGLARFVCEATPDAALTGAGMVMGTADYLAPEQASDPHAADIRADVYALGCTLYHLLAGRPPFFGRSLADKLLGHRLGDAAPLEAQRPDLPPDLAAVVRRMMAKQPADRYQTPAEAAAALEPFARPLPPRGRWRWPLLVAAGLSALAIGLLAVLLIVITDRGELTIKTVDDSVRVTVLRGGREVEVLDLKTRQKVRLRSGEYELRLGEGAAGLRLSTRAFTLKRGDTVIAEITHRPKSAPGTEPAPPATAPTPTPAERVTPGPVLRDHRDMVYAVAFSPDGKRAVTGGGFRRSSSADEKNHDYDLRVWDVASGRLERCLTGHRDRVKAVLFTSDGRHLLSGSTDNTIRRWDVDAGREVARATGGNLFALALIPGGRSALAATANPSALRIWELPGLTKSSNCGVPADIPFCVAVAPDGKRAASGGGLLNWQTNQPLPKADYDIWLWDVTTRTMQRRLKGHRATVWSVAFTADSTRLISGGADSTVRVWDVARGEEIERLRIDLGPHRARSGVSARCHCLALDPHGCRVACACDDGTLRLWDYEAHREIECVQADSRSLNSVAWSSDGHWLLTSSEGRDVRLWRVPRAAGRQ